MKHIRQGLAAHSQAKIGWRLPVSLVVITVIAITFFAIASPPKSGRAAPFTGCDTNGYLYKYPGGPAAPTQIHEVDMVTGQDSQVGSIAGHQINAVGYNPLDNFIYGWDDQNDTFVRVHGDHSTVDVLTIDSYTGPNTGIIIGDVDDNGHYWMLDGNTWYQIDLTTTPNPTQIATGTPVSNPTGVAGADWAFVPGTNAIWRIMDDGGDGRLWSFDRDSKTWTNHTPGTPIGGDGFSGSELTMGAFYADPDGHLYGSSNSTGNLWRVDVNNTPYTAGLVGAGNPSSSNDGARCALAPIPIDFGDSPDGYDTLFNSGGPRHSVIGYKNSTHTADLMLGKKLDIETDGFPGTEAHGDDDNNIDDEEAVQHIVATPGTPTALSVPVTVTNHTGDTATLAGWIDLDSSGTFDAGERVTHTVPSNSGTGVYELNFPETTFTANTFARFRVFDPSVADPQPTGSATGGEVEDYLVQVGSYEVEKTSTPANGSTVEPGDTIEYTLTINNTGLTDLVNLTIHDDLSDVLDDASLVGDPVISPDSAGSAVVNNDELEFVFTGDVLTGQTVIVTYSVKVNDPDNLGNREIKNHVIAAHSNCHPGVEDGQHTVPGDSACQTTHPVYGLANTGTNLIWPLIIASSLLACASIVWFGVRKQWGYTRNNSNLRG